MNGNRLYKQVVDQIIALIEEGDYPAGSRLPPERELAERFRVSRPAIREALIALEALDWVTIKTGSGIYVTHKGIGPAKQERISPFELMEARVIIEGEAAALAATLISPEQLQLLESALEEMAQENLEDNISSTDADKKFHFIIAQATNNAVLMSTVENIWAMQENMGHIKKVHQSVCVKDGEKRLLEHHAILDALKANNPQAAKLAMQQHFTRSIDAMHKASEAEAVEELQRKVSAARKRFSLDRILDKSLAAQ